MRLNRLPFGQITAGLRLLGLASALWSGAALHAATPPTLLPPPARLAAGEPGLLSVLLAPGTEAPGRLTALLRCHGGMDQEVVLERATPAQGAIATYTFVAPADLAGSVQLRLAGETRAPYVIELTEPSRAAAPATQATESPAATPPPVRFDWLNAFYSHEPLYASVGFVDEVDVRFQLSFKYQLFTTEPCVAKEIADNWLAPDGLYFGYTQTSLWDILDESSPFRDTSYKPSVFWQERDAWVREGSWGRARFAWQLGVEHESNGRSEPESRSINVAVFRPSLGYVSASGVRLLVQPKFYAYIEKTDNQDIDQFRGYTDLLLLARLPDDGLQFAATGRLGSKGNRGSVQVDITYPARDFGLPGYFLLQAFSGYGQTILEYDREADTQLRLGFSAIR